jgi:membrane-bound lytic murein transglycosylase B
LGVFGLVLTLTPSASAESADDARAKAKAVLEQVHAVQARVERAERAYDESLAAVAAGVNHAVQTERDSDLVTAQAAEATAALNGRVRGLYMSGGPLALYATLLTSGSVTDFQDRAAMVGHVVSSERLVVEANDAVVAQATQIATRADHKARRVIATERDVAEAARKVEALLAEQQRLLAAARQHADHLEEVEAAREAAAAAAAAFASITTARITTLEVMPASAEYMALYHRAAATCAGLSWTVLAAIGQVESGHGRNPAVSSAGAMGPMQFLPSTFASYAVDGNGDGQANIMDPSDAIFTAARYLCANGAGRGGGALANAIWHYNHADWYVQMVLTLAEKYAA